MAYYINCGIKCFIFCGIKVWLSQTSAAEILTICFPRVPLKIPLESFHSIENRLFSFGTGYMKLRGANKKNASRIFFFTQTVVTLENLT